MNDATKKRLNLEAVLPAITVREREEAKGSSVSAATPKQSGITPKNNAEHTVLNAEHSAMHVDPADGKKPVLEGTEVTKEAKRGLEKKKSQGSYKKRPRAAGDGKVMETTKHKKRAFEGEDEMEVDTVKKAMVGMEESDIGTNANDAGLADQSCEQK